MGQALELIGYNDKVYEKRTFPRFPFSYITFKGFSDNFVYQVMDISYEGMRLLLKNGELSFKESDIIKGEIHWKKESLNIIGTVKWINKNQLGVEFKKDNKFKSKVENFLSLKKVLINVKSIKDTDFDLEIPNNLLYWLQSDDLIKIFIWGHSGEQRGISSIQIIFMNNLIEWRYNRGVRTGKISQKQDIETPLFLKDEIIFMMDNYVKEYKVKFAVDIIDNLPLKLLSDETISFLKLKFS